MNAAAPVEYRLPEELTRDFVYIIRKSTTLFIVSIYQ